ncbi:ABC transporter ATP-binding protein [Mycobacteroides abscessus]|uniref:ABC transporter ATP-binding protein n=1 Tax=Mycobacteroides abscessus TaxID=36809 RepID=UPI0002584C03|nr:ABC transporter ATP-binding protein [Mycobacteroides abscessus]EIC67560.1 ABC transporter ATPase/permease [Mycobacteroides abscessus M93]
MPRAAASIWRLLRLCFRLERRLMILVLVAEFVAALPRPALVLCLGLLTGAAQQRQPAALFTALGGIAAVVCLLWLLSVSAERVDRRFRDRLAISMETHVAQLFSSIDTLEHHERPQYLDRLAVLRREVYLVNLFFENMVVTAIGIVQLLAITALLVSIDPILALLLVFAVPLMAVGLVRSATERRVEERAAADGRFAHHLFILATGAAPAKDIRLAGMGRRLLTDHGAAWNRWYRPIGRSRVLSACSNGAAWALYGVGYGMALYYVAVMRSAPASAVVMVLAAGIQMSEYVTATIGQLSFIRGVFLDTARRLMWLEDYRRAVSAAGALPVPERISRSITFEGVGFSYPGSAAHVLAGVSFTVPAGAVVAIVGENGAGKSTLVKLLAKFYRPTTGRILVDGVSLEDIATAPWRARVTGAFQDFATFEFSARESVGIGDLATAGDTAVLRAARRGGAETLVQRLPVGLHTQLGVRWPHGVALSFGEWQKVALSRGFMRDEPLLVVLDEPTAAIDSRTEYEWFQSFREVASAGRVHGRITMLISHRLANVQLADLIVVLAGGSVAELGTHDELLGRNGLYASMFNTQQQAYEI